LRRLPARVQGEDGTSSEDEQRQDPEDAHGAASLRDLRERLRFGVVVRIADQRFGGRKDAGPKEVPCALSKEKDPASVEADRRNGRQHRSAVS
jgi:hypothetical protein